MSSPDYMVGAVYETPWRERKIRLGWLPLAVIVSIFAGAWTNHQLDQPVSVGRGAVIRELTSQERAAFLIHQETVPLTAILRIVPKAEFHATRSNLVKADASFYYDGHIPCTITIPDKWVIRANPSRGMAWFEDQGNDDFDDVLAHELLHCIRGAWHPDPPK